MGATDTDGFLAPHRQTRTAECRQRSANPLPRKQMVTDLWREKAGRIARPSIVYMFVGAGNGTRTRRASRPTLHAQWGITAEAFPTETLVLSWFSHHTFRTTKLSSFLAI